MSKGLNRKLAGFPATGFHNLSEDLSEYSVMRRRHQLEVHPRFRMVDSCAAEFAAEGHLRTFRMNFLDDG